MLIQQLNSFTIFVQKSLEQNNLTEDSLKLKLLQFLKHIMHYLTKFPNSKYEHAFQEVQLTEKTISNISNFLHKKIKHWPFKKIFLGHNYSFDSDGFETDELSSNESEEQLKTKRAAQSNVPQQQPKLELQSYSDQTTLINELKMKLEQQDEQMSKMTKDYLKDMQHLKMTFLRQLENPEHEFVEVSYYDINSGLEPEVKQYIQDKVNYMKQQYEQRLQFYRVQITASNIEVESYRKTIQIILQQNTLQSAVKTVFTIEKDLYKFWKEVQDLVGNKIIFSIFEKQLGGYGINYKEIDELINKSSSSSRVFQRQKDLMEEQIKSLIEECSQQIKELNSQIQQKDQQISELQEFQGYNLQKVREELQTTFEQQLRDQKRYYEMKMEKEFQRVTKDLIGIKSEKLIKQVTLKAALSRWRDYGLFCKLYKQKVDEMESYQLQIKIVNLLQTTDISFIQQDLRKLRKKYNDLQYKLNEMESQNKYLKEENIVLQHSYEKMLNNFIMISATLNNMRQQTMHIERATKVLQKPLISIFQRLGYQFDPSQSLLSLRNVNIIQGGIEISDFINRIKPDAYLNELNACIDVYLKGRIAQEQIYEQGQLKDNFTITDIFDIRNEINQQWNQEGLESQCDITEPFQIQIQQQQQQQQNTRINTDNQKSNQFQNESQQTPKNYEEKQLKIKTNPTQSKDKTPKSFNRNKKTSPSRFTQSRNKDDISLQKTNNLTKQSKTNERDPGTFTRYVDRFEKSQKPDNIQRQQFLRPISLINKASPISTTTQLRIIMSDKAIQVTPQDLFDEIKQQKKKNLENIIHQDILVIMTNNNKKEENFQQQQKSFLTSRNNTRKIQDISLFEAQKRKSLNKTFIRDQQSNSPEVGSDQSQLLLQNPFQYYQDVFQQKKKLQFKNYTIQQEQNCTLSKLIQDRRRLEITGGIEGKPLSIPPYLKQ